MSALNHAAFVDLTIGSDFAEVKGLGGAPGVGTAPAEWADEIANLRDACARLFLQFGDEFSVTIDDTLYRVTTVTSVDDQNVYFLSRSDPETRDFFDIGYPQSVVDFLMAQDLTGMVLFGGPQGAGKTASLGAYTRKWISLHGGNGLAVQDPHETNLNGRHGRGRIIQVSATEKNGGYAWQLKKGLRTRAAFTYIGEIREPAVAFEAVQSSNNGHLIGSTAHGDDIPAVLRRVASYAAAKSLNANSLLAGGLAVVIWQELTSITVPIGDGKTKVVKSVRSEHLLVKDQPGVQGKIRDGKFDQLVQEIEQQRNDQAWAM